MTIEKIRNNIASCTCEYCHVGDVVGIKGRLQSSKYTDDNNIPSFPLVLHGCHTP